MQNATNTQINIGSKVKTVRFYNGLVAFPIWSGCFHFATYNCVNKIMQ